MAEFDVNSDTLEAGEKPALSALLGKSGATAASSLSDLLGRAVTLDAPTLTQMTTDQLVKAHTGPIVMSKAKYVEVASGMNWLMLKEKDAAVIADLMMGNDGSSPPDELTDIQLSAVSEVLSQVFTTTTSTLSKAVGARIGMLSPGDAQLAPLKDAASIAEVMGGSSVVRVSYKLGIEGLVTSELQHVMPLKFAKQLVAAGQNAAAAAKGGGSAVTAPQSPAMQPSSVIVGGAAAAPVGPAVVQPAQFIPLGAGFGGGTSSNVDLLMDVPLQITVELGRATKLVKDILALGPGSIVQLDKLAGEPVDILVNDKLVARGEVVVIDESFGVRVTDIVSPRERLSGLA